MYAYDIELFEPLTGLTPDPGAEKMAKYDYAYDNMPPLTYRQFFTFY